MNHGFYCFGLCVLIWPKARDFLENLKLARIFGSPVVSLRFHRKASRRFKSIKVSADDNRFKTENEGKTIEPHTTPFMYTVHVYTIAMSFEGQMVELFETRPGSVWLQRS